MIMNEWIVYLLFAAGMFFLGLYCLLTMRNLIKLFIGIEIIGKGVSLVLLSTGLARKSILLAQSLVVTYIVLEVSLVAVALAVIINLYRANQSLDIRSLTRLKG
ncbi:MAG: NADH-quinone oxidoreductase subunit K [Candidatus Aminicenantes bacterium]|nr:NADH-quinone oxidoreductase subunit K [Candidatus Aminicenantes bacterium]